MRVGPNAQFWPPKKRTHAFDGEAWGSGWTFLELKMSMTSVVVINDDGSAFDRHGDLSNLAFLFDDDDDGDDGDDDDDDDDVPCRKRGPDDPHGLTAE